MSQNEGKLRLSVRILQKIPVFCIVFMEFLSSRVMCKRGSFEGRVLGDNPKTHPPHSHSFALGEQSVQRQEWGEETKGEVTLEWVFFRTKNTHFVVQKIDF